MKKLEHLEKYNLILDLKFRSERTKESYINAAIRFMKDNSRLTHLSSFHIKEYMSIFRTKYSDSYFNIMGSSLKLFYSEVLNQPQKLKWFHPVKIHRKFHKIVTHDQFVFMMKSTDNLKHKLIIIMLYATGLRESELINLKLSHIDLIESNLFVDSLKNGKNRYIPIHHILLKYIKAYIIKYNPKEYLLEGQKLPKYSATSIRNIIHKASNGNAYPHLLRHTYLTNIIEKEDVFAAWN